jgi:hypothetical protein
VRKREIVLLFCRDLIDRLGLNVRYSGPLRG